MFYRRNPLMFCLSGAVSGVVSAIEELHERTAIDDEKQLISATNPDGYSFHMASKRLTDDRDVVLAAVQQERTALLFASKRLKDDRGAVLAALQNDGMALRYASERLRGDRGVVLAALQQDGMALQYASESLRADEKVVAHAIKQNPSAERYSKVETFGELFERGATCTAGVLMAVSMVALGHTTSKVAEKSWRAISPILTATDDSLIDDEEDEHVVFTPQALG